MDEEAWSKPKGKSSFVWDHFKQNQSKTLVKCNHCRKVFKHCAATTNYSRHLSNKHSITPDKKLEDKSERRAGQSTIEDAFAREV